MIILHLINFIKYLLSIFFRIRKIFIVGSIFELNQDLNKLK